ncbi:MAG: DUF3373 family protein [Deferrisomatales bacterium]|nr:DUF3373 family protein [Deferrisomatales bacterium]
MQNRAISTITALAGLLSSLALPPAPRAADASAPADTAALAQKVEDLEHDVERLKKKSLGSWLEVGGDYRFRVDSLRADVAGHADAMEFVNNMTTDLVSRQDPDEIARFMLTQDRAAQMDKLFSYFPGAMATNITAPQAAFGGFSMIDALAGMPADQVTGMLQMTSLTSQQAAILGSLLTPEVFGGVMANLTPADQATLMSIMGDPDKAQLFQQLVAQGLLGGGEGSYAVPRGDQKVKNNTLYTNRFAIDLKAKPLQGITVHARLLMYKTFGSGDDQAVTGNYFADRVGVFDGTLGHVPSSDFLSVDQAYVTWSNIADLPVWFSVGRRPSTGGSPSHVRDNREPPGNGGVPSLLVDYAFDGMTLGAAPDFDSLPGFYTKICYGRGFESGFDRDDDDNIEDTDMIGVALVPVDIAPLRIDFQWNRGMNIFDFPVMQDTVFGDTAPSVNLGDIDWFGVGVLSHFRDAGLTGFANYGLSITHPNDKVSFNAGNQGLLTGDFFAPENPEDKTGWAVYLGGRYDVKATGTSIGAEWNHGSKNWITFAPAADDAWTAKLGTRGNVYEVYLIQDLNLKPMSSYFARAFFRIGYQYYDFDYTGSNNWVGAPKKISELEDTDLALLAPIEMAQNIYASFEVHF